MCRVPHLLLPSVREEIYVKENTEKLIKYVCVCMYIGYNMYYFSLVNEAIKALCHFLFTIPHLSPHKHGFMR